MAKNQSMFFLIALFVFGAVFESSVAQTSHIVGDSVDWRIPSDGAATYTTWASQQTFSVGDVLVFNFPAGTHDVAEVSKAAYDACTATSPMLQVTTAPANVNITSAGDHYYICTFTGHCQAGQKLSITVSADSTNTPPTGTTLSPPPPSTTTTPSPSSSATSLAAMTLPVTLFSIAIALFH